MKVRIHYTAPDGRPVACTGDYFVGGTFLEVIEGMMLNPFTTDAAPLDYMRDVLAGIGDGELELPSDPDEAAEAFLAHLLARGFASFVAEGGDAEKEKLDKKDEITR